MRRRSLRAQAAFEYVLLLGLVVVITLVAMNKYLKRVNRDTGVVFNAAACAVMGTPVDTRLREGATNYP